MKIMTMSLALGFSLFAGSAQADLVSRLDWSVGEVSGTIDTSGNFQLKEAIPSLECHFEDGSRAISKTKGIDLDSTIEEVISTADPYYAGLHHYKITAKPGRLKARVFLADLRSCQYVLTFLVQMDGNQKAVTGQIVMAESTSNTLNDKDLAKKISSDLERIELTVNSSETSVLSTLK